MKNLLFTFGLLLTMEAYCAIDTLELTSEITSVEVKPEGALISRNLNLDLSKGNYLIHIQNLPANLNGDFVEFETLKGIGVVEIQVVSPLDKLEQQLSIKNIQSIGNEISRITKHLKQLDVLEKDLVQLKGRFSGKNLSINQVKATQKEFQQENTEIKKQRQDAYKELMLLRETSDSNQFAPQQIKSTMHGNQSDIFIEVIILDDIKESWAWSYFIPNGIIIEPEMADENAPLPPTADLIGKVVESVNGAPIMFATVEFYQDKKLCFSTTTDYNGVFNQNLATLSPYDMMITFDGYKKKKVKNVFLSRVNLPVQTFTMAVKQKLSPLEIVAYALPLLDVLRLVAQ